MTVCRASSIALDAGHISYFGPQGAQWRVPVTAVKVIGELKSMDEEEGHFLAIIVAADGSWFQAPCCAVGMDGVLAELGRALNTVLSLHLSTSPAPNSRVVWPPAAAEQALFAIPPIDDAGQSGRSSTWALHPSVSAYLDKG